MTRISKLQSETKHGMAGSNGYRQSKYGNVKTQIDGITFDSKAESRRYCELKLLQQAGEIKWFNRQPSFLVSREVRYRPDFIICRNDGTIYVEDVKGISTPEFLIKAKLWAEHYPGMELVIID